MGGNLGRPTFGDAEGAISAYLEAHRTGMEPDPVERWNPAEPLVEAASLALQSGDRERAVSIANQALEVIDSRAPADDTRWSAGLELRATMTLGRALGDLGSPVAALEDMERGRASAERATASTDTPTWMLELCEEWYRLQSTLLDSIGDRDEARKAERHADELRERLGPEDPEPA